MTEFPINPEATQLVNRTRSSDTGIFRPPNDQVKFSKMTARSRGATKVEAQHAAEPRSSDNATVLVPDRLGRSDELITDTLVISLLSIMRAISGESAVKRSGAEENHPPEALILDGFHEPLRDGVAVRGPRGAAHHGDPGVLEDLGEPARELGVTVEDEEPRVPKEATLGVGEDVRDLSHEHAVGVHGRGDDLHGPGRVVDHE